MIRREGDVITYEERDQLQQHAGWVVPPTQTPAQAVETGAAMLHDVDRVVTARMERAGETGALERDDVYYAEQRKIDVLRNGAQLIFAACPVEREQFLVEEQVRRGEIK